MRTVLIILSLVILAGCSPQRRLARLHERFPPDTITKIEYRDTIIYRDTTLFRYLPGDTVVIIDSFAVEVDLPYMELTRASTLAEAKAWVQGRAMGLELIQKDSMFQFLLDSALVNNIDSIFILKEVPFPVEIKPNPFYKNGFFILAGLILIGMLLWFLFRKR